jgi:hypothetical protein
MGRARTERVNPGFARYEFTARRKTHRFARRAVLKGHDFNRAINPA